MTAQRHIRALLKEPYRRVSVRNIRGRWHPGHVRRVLKQMVADGVIERAGDAYDTQQDGYEYHLATSSS